MQDKYDAGKDPYIDPENNILRNKLGITDQGYLDEIEAELVTQQIVDITVNYSPKPENIEFGTLQYIHKRLFGDIYDWAGQTRTVELAKGDTKFAAYQHIEAEAKRIFAELRSENCLADAMPFEDYVARLAHYYSELNVLHPFREGNGRAIRTFMSVLAYQSRRMFIDWDKIKPSENISACVRGYFGDEQPLAQLLMKATFEVDK